MATWTKIRSDLANRTKKVPPDAPELTELRRALRAARAESYIAELLAGAPPLSDEQRRTLAGLLAPAGGRDVT